MQNGFVKKQPMYSFVFANGLKKKKRNPRIMLTEFEDEMRGTQAYLKMVYVKLLDLQLGKQKNHSCAAISLVVPF